jgi:hypothetical protein
MKRNWRCVIGCGLLALFGLATTAWAADQPKSKDATKTKDGKLLSDTAKGRKPADTTFDGRKHVEPVQSKPSRTTPEKAIKQYKESGKPNGTTVKMKTKEPPPPPKPAAKKTK